MNVSFADIREGPEVIVEKTTRMFRVLWPKKDQTIDEVEADAHAVLGVVVRMRAKWKA